jgi:hypothetical protein
VQTQGDSSDLGHVVEEDVASDQTKALGRDRRGEHGSRQAQQIPWTSDSGSVAECRAAATSLALALPRDVYDLFSGTVCVQWSREAVTYARFRQRPRGRAFTDSTTVRPFPTCPGRGPDASSCRRVRSCQLSRPLLIRDLRCGDSVGFILGARLRAGIARG